jgi:aspartyl-tRNA(Asn)/glutamyl-tRNA(Gln) amidotransferase subunit C
MSKFSDADILKLAELSKLELSPEEVKSFKHELTSIMGYVERLQTVDTTGLLPTSQVTGLQNVTREDEIIDYGVAPKDLLKNAPEQQDNQFKTKRMIG